MVKFISDTTQLAANAAPVGAALQEFQTSLQRQLIQTLKLEDLLGRTNHDEPANRLDSKQTLLI
jgi:hypothetical protein